MSMSIQIPSSAGRAFFGEGGVQSPECMTNPGALLLSEPVRDVLPGRQGVSEDARAFNSLIATGDFTRQESSGPLLPSGRELSGGFPSTSASEPVHSVGEPAVSPRPQPPLSEVSSGEHHSKSPKSHPFGEPTSGGQFRSATSQSSFGSHGVAQENAPEFLLSPTSRTH